MPRIVSVVRPRKSILSSPIVLEQAHWVLRRDVAFALAARPLQRHVLDQRVARDHDAGRVGRGVAGDALDALGRVDQSRACVSLS